MGQWWEREEVERTIGSTVSVRKWKQARTAKESALYVVRSKKWLEAAGIKFVDQPSPGTFVG